MFVYFQAETERQRFRAVLQEVTSSCWDKCMGTPSTRLDRRTESCFAHCIERFVDTGNYVINRLEREGQQHMAREAAARQDAEELKW